MMKESLFSKLTKKPQPPIVEKVAEVLPPFKDEFADAYIKVGEALGYEREEVVGYLNELR